LKKWLSVCEKRCKIENLHVFGMFWCFSHKFGKFTCKRCKIENLRAELSLCGTLGRTFLASARWAELPSSALWAEHSLRGLSMFVMHGKKNGQHFVLLNQDQQAP